MISIAFLAIAALSTEVEYADLVEFRVRSRADTAGSCNNSLTCKHCKQNRPTLEPQTAKAGILIEISNAYPSLQCDRKHKVFSAYSENIYHKTWA